MSIRLSHAVRRSAALAALVFCAAPLLAQGARGEGVGAGGTFPYVSVFLSTGGSYSNTNDLNTRLDTAGFFSVSNDAIAYGGGIRGRWGRLVVGGEFSAANFGEEGDPNTGKTSAMRSRLSTAQVGYAWWAGRHLNVYPMLGVGAGTMEVTLTNRNGGGQPPAGVAPTFTEVVLHPNYTSKLEATYLVFEPAVGADWLVLRSVGDRFGLTIGARAGKRMSPNRATWRLAGTKVHGGPDVGPDGSYFRVTFGLGWR